MHQDGACFAHNAWPISLNAGWLKERAHKRYWPLVEEGWATAARCAEMRAGKRCNLLRTQKCCGRGCVVQEPRSSPASDGRGFFFYQFRDNIESSKVPSAR